MFNDDRSMYYPIIFRRRVVDCTLFSYSRTAADNIDDGCCN